MAKLKEILAKQDWKLILKNYGLVFLGSLLLAVGTGVFLLPAVLNTGGMMGLGLIAQHLFGFDPDLVVLVLTWIFFLLSLLFVGWRFTLKSLISSLVYPLLLILLMRVPGIANETAKLFGEGADVATKLIAGVFGGVFCGVGVALTFRGGGSTGGVDIVVVLINKYLHISHSILSFLVDALIVLIGLFVMQNVILSLVGIISAFVYALTLEYVFVGRSHVLSAYIISPTKSAEINEWIQTKTKRGSTLMPIRGGYKGDEYTMILVNFDRSEYGHIIDGIAKIDKDAFITINQSKSVLGEGFKTLEAKEVDEALIKLKKNKDE